MRVKFLHRFVLGAVLLSLSAACVQEEHPSAEFLEIDPRVEMNTVCTKVHTGSVDENLGKEYLVWDELDALTVWDQGNAGQYTFTNGRWYSPSPIRLTAGQTKTLYGLYDGTRNSGEPVSRVHASIRGDYSAGGYSVAKRPMAAKFGPAQVNGAVPLVFTPLFTQLSFVFRSAGTLTGLKVMGESPIAGDFQAQIGDNGNHSITLEGNLSNEVKMSALEDSSSNDYQKDTPYHCYILPNYTGPVSLQFQGTDGKPHYVVLNIPQAQKHYVFYIDLEKGEQPVNTDGYYLDVVSDGADFVLENSGGVEKTVVKVVSYKRTNASGSSLELEPVPFRVEVFTGNRGSSADWADNSKWQPLTAGTPPSSLVYTNWVRLGGTSTVFDGGINSDPVAVTFQAGNHSVALAGDGIEAQQATFLQNSTHRSGVANLDPSKPETAVDLSLYDATGRPIARGRSTANCYVVSAPGWYKIPAVYGNALIHGEINGSTFLRPRLVRDESYFEPSYRKSGYIQGGTGATLVWQDGQNVISGNTSAQKPFFRSKTDSGEAFDYIYFYISPDNIKSCNAVVGLKGSEGYLTDVILWSWHIWITPQLMETAQENGLSSMTVGWIDTESTTESYNAPRGELLRVVQLRADRSGPDPAAHAPRYFTLSQLPSSLLQTTRYINRGRTVYYAYGRKDPFYSFTVDGATDGATADTWVPVWDGDGNQMIATGDNLQEKQYKNNYLAEQVSSVSALISFSEAVRKPWRFTFVGTSTETNYYANWGGLRYSAHQSNENAGKKSVLDPSPYGFKLWYSNQSILSAYLELVGDAARYTLAPYYTFPRTGAYLLNTIASPNSFITWQVSWSSSNNQITFVTIRTGVGVSVPRVYGFAFPCRPAWDVEAHR